MKIKIEKGQILRIRFPNMKEHNVRPAVVISTPPEIRVVPLRTSHYHRSDLHTVMVEKTESDLGRKLSADCGCVTAVDKNSIVGVPLAQLDPQMLARIEKKTQ